MNPTTDGPGSLNRLHDIVTVPPAPWWPPLPAWDVLAVLLLTGLTLLIAWGVIRRRVNWYRRAGLLELQRIEQAPSADSTALIELAELVKRIALVAYPRQNVAALTGAEWLQFLDRTSDTTDFTQGPGRQLGEVYDRSASAPRQELMDVVRRWIGRHRRDAGC